MPELPSGRHFALGTGPLSELLESVTDGFRIHELMAIETPEDLSRYLEIYYFRPCGEDEEATEYTEASLTPPDGMIPYRSGQTLKTISGEWSRWPDEDRQAFVDFLNEPRFRDYLNDLFDYVEEFRQTIRDSGPFAARVQAHWWDAGCHPLQPGNENPEG